MESIFTGVHYEGDMCQVELIELCSAGQSEFGKKESNNSRALQNVPEAVRAVCLLAARLIQSQLNVF